MKNLKDVPVGYDGIISKGRATKGIETRIKEATIVEKKINHMGLKSEQETSNVKLHQHPHYHEKIYGRQ